MWEGEGSFSFGFGQNAVVEALPQAAKSTHESQTIPADAQARQISQEEGVVVEEKDIERIAANKSGSVWVLRIKQSAISNALPGTPLAHVVANSDRERNVYEGGLKVWECTYDVISFLEQHPEHINGKQFLDMGCGHGLVGACAIANFSPTHVLMQDFNAAVIRCVTIPTCVANLRARAPHVNSPPPTIVFASGDWAQLAEEHQKNPNFLVPHSPSFDTIVSVETVYDPASFVSVLLFLETFLVRSSGVVVLCGKTHYFGVGGGTRVFVDFVERQHRSQLLGTEWKWEIQRAAVIEDGTSNRREILLMRIVKV